MDRPTILQAIGVRKTFGGLVAVDDVSFRVHEGQCLALIGPNGAGKTTLLNVIAGSLPPTSGTVLLEGHSLNGASAHERARLGIGRTFQQALTFKDMTVLENVMVGCHLQGRSRLIDVALRLPRMRREEDDIYLEALRYLNLVGLGTHAEETAGILPFGQQRLLAIARALASKPKVLLLDEPAAGLNRLEKNALVDLIRRLREMEITAILVEHDMEVVMQLAEWIVVLDHGSRLAQGSPDEVRHNPAVIEAYLGVEAA